ncbi:unnamed protein product [Toxocara canis]|uniref:DUF1540 domain-containing protein n=1 Tax=Toxocara canis TaxID=6265 RepID=A0A183V401_TOXCA|nr:unnamed protein product [Toxocara canis]
MKSRFFCHGCVDIRVNDCVDGYMDIRVSDCIDGCMDIRVSDCVDGYMDIRVSDCIDGCMDIRVSDCIDGCTDIRFNECIKCSERSTENSELFNMARYFQSPNVLVEMFAKRITHTYASIAHR